MNSTIRWVFTLDEGCLPCQTFSLFIGKLMITLFGVTLGTRGVAWIIRSAHWIVRYSLWTGGVANLSDSGVFTLDQGCRLKLLPVVQNPISLGINSTLYEDDTPESKHQKMTRARFTLLSR